jgi:hypothetical protein
MWAGTAVPALPFPAVDTGLTGQKMAGRQAAAAVLCFSEKKKTVSPLCVSLFVWQVGPKVQQVPHDSATSDPVE